MRIKDLRRVIVDLDDNLLIGGKGHFGEMLDIPHCSVGEVRVDSWRPETVLALIIYMDNPGEEPECTTY